MKEIIIDRYPALLIYNPVFYFIDIYHDIFVYSKAPSIDSLFKITLMATLTLILAAYLYKKMTSTIKDII